MGLETMLQQAMELQAKATKEAVNKIKSAQRGMSKDERIKFKKDFEENQDIKDILAMAEKHDVNIDGFKI
jgi:hypothetical protein